MVADRELAQVKEEAIPELHEEARQYQDEVLKLQGELQLQQKTVEEVVESEAKAKADIKVHSVITKEC